MIDNERIWAPWRIAYIAGESSAETRITADSKSTETQILPNQWHAGADHGCFLCRAAGEYADAKLGSKQNLVVARSNHAIGLLNRFPYNNGHLLVSPLRHVAELRDLSDNEHLAAMRMLGDFTRIMSEKICAEGFNIGLNLGSVAGAGVPGHLHWHLVPRWPNDTNFMASVAGIRVIPQSLEALWEALTDEGDHGG
jgi:ATP adenylyltransferase